MSPIETDLFLAIPERCSTRAECDGRAVGRWETKLLAAAARDDPVDVTVFADQGDLERIGKYVVAGNTAQMEDPYVVPELRQWLHFNADAAAAHRDGLYTALGLKYAFINQAVEVPDVRRQFATFLGVGSRRPDLLIRFGYGPDMPRSLRRPIEDVIVVS